MERRGIRLKVKAVPAAGISAEKARRRLSSSSS
jgi:hypothetical protein